MGKTFKIKDINHILYQRGIIEEIIYWIEENLCNTLNIDIISKKAGYSKWYFQRVFKLYMGCTISNHIRRRRLSKSALDLIISDNLIIDIAIKYQFNSLQSYNRAFKRTFKLSPKQYRKKFSNWYH